MKLYKIKNWSSLFENNRSKTVTRLDWIPIPNSHDGENYSMLMEQENAAELYTAWVLMLQVASKCQPRGTLLRGNCQPHDARSLAIKTRARQEWFESAFAYLSRETDWLEWEEFTPKIEPERQSGVTQVTSETSVGCQAGVYEGKEGKGIEVKEFPAPDCSIPVVSEVVRYGAGRLSDEIPADYCEHYHCSKTIKESWVNGYGRLINWQMELAKWWSGDKHKWCNGTHTAKKAARKPTAHRGHLPFSNDDPMTKEY